MSTEAARADRAWKSRWERRWRHRRWRTIFVAALVIIAACLLLGPVITSSDSAGPATSSTNNLETEAQTRGDIIRLTNRERREKCPGSLVADANLMRSARRHATDMARRHYFDHDTRNGPSWDARIRSDGYKGSAIGENIARGQETPVEVMAAWMGSEGHKRNILDCDFKVIGVGYVAQGRWWVQDFGG